MYLELHRRSDNGIQTVGDLLVFDHSDKLLATFKTLELPFKENKRRVSCIPAGRYYITKNWSARFGRGFKVMNVPNRDGILIHCGNFNHQTKGCILIGLALSDINMDGQKDVIRSASAMASLRVIVTQSVPLLIKNCFTKNE